MRTAWWIAAAALLAAGCAGAKPRADAGDVGAPASPATPVRTRSGLVAGKATSQPGVRAYLGIPYAAAPVGDLRWRPPRPAPAWSGVRAADGFAPACMQPGPAAFGPWTLEFLLRGPVGEDCLFLNVWTAAAAGERTEPRPVFVWIHGGAFTGGSGDVPVYDGAHLAARGLVVVTINYRLGALGFLAHPELSAESPEHASGNYGLLDQVAALHWVHDNIRAFGGDPVRVTIAGQSAGAISVFLLTASPAARGLFQRAIIESGPGGLAAMGLASARSTTRPRADAEGDGVAFARALGATSIAQLRALPASAFLPSSAGPALRFGPVVDGLFLSENPADVFAAGRQNDVPTLTGLNADEGSAFPGYGKATAAAFRQQAQQRWGERAGRFLALYPAGSDEEAGRSQVESGRDAGSAGVTALLLERARTARLPAFAYYFDRAIPWPEHPEFGAFHTAEVPYVFGTLDALPRPWTEVDRRLSETMMSYWVNFAARGDPNGAAVPGWEAFTAARPVLQHLGEHIGPLPPLPAGKLELISPAIEPLEPTR